MTATGRLEIPPPLCTPTSLTVLLLVPVVLTCATSAVSAAPTGAYDGSYDPASENPPKGMTSWAVVQGHNCAIKPNTPAPGQALFDDSGLQIGSFLNIRRRLDAKADFGGRPMETEYEFRIRVTVQAAGTATMPNFQVGFRDEGGGGRCVCLAWYRTAPRECLLALMQPSTAGPVVPVTYWDWLDNAPHTYTVKKYRDPANGKMVVQVLIDGESQFRTPVAYTRLPRDTGGRQGFQFGTSSYTKGRYLVDDIRFGPLKGVPPVAVQDAILTARGGAEVTASVPGPWQLVDDPDEGKGRLEEDGAAVRLTVTGRARATSGRLLLKPNRTYVIKATYKTTGSRDTIRNSTALAIVLPSWQGR